MFSQMIALFGKFAVAGIIIPYIITWILYFIFGTPFLAICYFWYTFWTICK